MEKRTFAALAAVLLGGATARVLAAGQDWQVTHRSGTYGDYTGMAAFADADTGAGRMNLYCDTRDGFRIQFAGVHLAMAEGAAKAIFAIDGGAPVTLAANIFGDEDDASNLVVAYNSDRVERRLATAKHIVVRFVDYTNRPVDASFRFGDLAAEKATLLKVCPIARR